MLQKESLISERKKIKTSGALGALNRGNSRIELEIKKQKNIEIELKEQ